MRRSLRLACALGLTLLIVGCNRGDDDDDSGNTPGGGLIPSQVCSDLAYEQCDRIWACASEAQRRSLGYNGIKLDCSGNGIEQLGCTTATQNKICAGSGASSAADAATCSNQIKAADCSDVATKPVSSYAPACGQCALDP